RCGINVQSRRVRCPHTSCGHAPTQVRLVRLRFGNHQGGPIGIDSKRLAERTTAWSDSSIFQAEQLLSPMPAVAIAVPGIFSRSPSLPPQSPLPNSLPANYPLNQLVFRRQECVGLMPCAGATPPPVPRACLLPTDSRVATCTGMLRPQGIACPPNRNGCTRAAGEHQGPGMVPSKRSGGASPTMSTDHSRSLPKHPTHSVCWTRSETCERGAGTGLTRRRMAITGFGKVVAGQIPNGAAESAYDEATRLTRLSRTPGSGSHAGPRPSPVRMVGKAGRILQIAEEH